MSFFPFCSDDVDDVPSFGFVAPHHSSWVGSILHEFHCFWMFFGVFQNQLVSQTGETNINSCVAFWAVALDIGNQMWI